DLITHHEPDAAETHWRTHIATTPTQPPSAVLDLLGLPPEIVGRAGQGRAAVARSSVPLPRGASG
ncbi:FadR family transcriptional regulator, partial [Frankia sp. Cpl3]|nr:FadR family transcriptional regulator [Frankia sp. Cpl3]